MLTRDKIKALYVRERGSVEVELDNGWSILLGREELMDRLSRALAVTDRLKARGVKETQIRIDAWHQMVSHSIAHFLP